MTPDAFEQAVHLLLQSEAVMTLATVGEGLPWATDVYFAPHGYNLVFFSSSASRHGKNLQTNTACAATIHPAVKSWKEIRGLQMEGQATPIASAGEIARASECYIAKFPFARDLLTRPLEVLPKLSSARPYLFTPRTIYYLDNSLGFGTRYVVSLEDGRVTGPPQRANSR